MRIHHSLLLTLIIVAGTSLLVAGCNKDKYTTKPQLTFKSVNSYSVAQRENLTLNLNVTDKEGDIQNFVFVQTIVKHFPDLTRTDSFPVSQDLPTIRNLNTAIVVCYSINVIDGSCPVYSARSTQLRDTTTFRFWIKDKADNVSDTVQTDKPIVVQN